MSHYEPDYDAPKPCRHCGRTRDHHRLNTGECVVPPAPASGGQCIRPERSEVNAPAVGSHVTSPEARGDGSGDRRDGGPDAPRKLCSCTALGLGAPAGRCPKCGGWQECHPCTGPGYCAEHGCIKTRASAPPPPAPAPEDVALTAEQIQAWRARDCRCANCDTPTKVCTGTHCPACYPPPAPAPEDKA